MLQQEEPDDYVIATGEVHSVREFVDEVFGLLDLDFDHPHREMFLNYRLVAQTISYSAPHSNDPAQVDDQIIFYTDGITDAPNSRGERFGSTRLDKVLSECRPEASGVIGAVLEAVDRFADGTPADDDQTLLIAKIR